MADEFHEGAEVLSIDESGHYIAEECVEEFVRAVLGFAGMH